MWLETFRQAVWDWLPFLWLLSRSLAAVLPHWTAWAASPTASNGVPSSWTGPARRGSSSARTRGRARRSEGTSSLQPIPSRLASEVNNGIQEAPLVQTPIERFLSSAEVLPDEEPPLFRVANADGAAADRTAGSAAAGRDDPQRARHAGGGAEASPAVKR